MAAVSAAGELMTWGHGVALGFKDGRHRLEPCAVGGVPLPVRGVSCGHHHTAAIGADGTLWTFGAGADQQLGHGAWCG
jgi:hypothetical protein